MQAALTLELLKPGSHSSIASNSAVSVVASTGVRGVIGTGRVCVTGVVETLVNFGTIISVGISVIVTNAAKSTKSSDCV